MYGCLVLKTQNRCKLLLLRASNFLSKVNFGETSCEPPPLPHREEHEYPQAEPEILSS